MLSTASNGPTPNGSEKLLCATGAICYRSRLQRVFSLLVFCMCRNRPRSLFSIMTKKIVNWNYLAYVVCLVLIILEHLVLSKQKKTYARP